jgi:hypothetical protein
MTQDVTVPGNPEPGPDNFDFEAYLEGVSTFPVFKHTAYLDQKSGAELGDVLDELEALVQEAAALNDQIDRRTKSPSNSFVDSTLDGYLSDREAQEGRIALLLSMRDALRDKVIASGITLTFQVKTPEELGTVTREATRNFHKENRKFANAKEDDLDYITARSRYTITAQIAHFCTGMRLADGREVPPPTRIGADKLVRSLIASETMRLMESVGTGLSASRDWAQQVDAGFLGGSADVEVVGLDQVGAEGGEVVGDPAPDHADGERVDLV